MSIETTEQGTYRVRWRGLDNVQHSKVFKRKRDATAFENDTRSDLGRGIYIDARAGALQLSNWADQWLEEARNLGDGGRETYRRDLDRYILAREIPGRGTMGGLPLRKVDHEAIDALLTAELAAGLAPSTVHRHYRTLRRMLQVAVDKGRISRNPCDKVTPPKIPPGEMRFLSVEEVDLLAAKITTRYSSWVEVAAWGGLRWSEAVGLRRARVDGDRVQVAEQLIRRADREWHRDPPKSKAGRRTVTLPPSVGDRLGSHLGKWSNHGPDGLVFPNQHGDPMNGPSFLGSVFRPALKRAGLDPKIRVHDLRHTAVALSIAAGAHPKAIQARLGHASISVTLDRYGHLYPEMDGDLAASLDALRDPGPAGRP